MKKNFLVTTAFLSGLLLLSACGTAQSAPGDNGGQNPGQRGRGQGFSQQDLQKFADEANAASDKTTLTKDQFTAEVQALMQAQRAQYQQQNGGQQFSRGNGTGSGGARGSFGGANGNGMQNRLATATTFIKYTDPSGNEALIAEDVDGKVLMKFPRAFGGRGGPGGGQPPMGNAPAAQ